MGRQLLQGNWADFTGSNRNLFFTNPQETNHSKVDAFGLLTGQVGYAWNNVLFDVKGGAAVVGDKYDSFYSASGLPVIHGSETRWGGTIGAGLEFGFAPIGGQNVRQEDRIWVLRVALPRGMSI